MKRHMTKSMIRKALRLAGWVELGPNSELWYPRTLPPKMAIMEVRLRLGEFHLVTNEKDFIDLKIRYGKTRSFESVFRFVKNLCRM